MENTIMAGEANSIFIDGYVQGVEVGYSNIQGTITGNKKEISNINKAPLFVQQGYWDDNGTPDDWSDDVWHSGDYHLKSAGWRWDSIVQEWTWDDVTSPCIDASNPGMALGDEAVTLAVDPMHRWGENVRLNMGAYGGTAEASMAPPGWALLADLDNSGAVGLVDLTLMAGLWLEAGEHLPGDISRDGAVNLEDAGLLAQDWLKTTVWY